MDLPSENSSRIGGIIIGVVIAALIAAVLEVIGFRGFVGQFVKNFISKGAEAVVTDTMKPTERPAISYSPQNLPVPTAPAPAPPASSCTVAGLGTSITVGNESMVGAAWEAGKQCLVEGRIGLACNNFQRALLETKSESTRQGIRAAYDRNCMIR